MGIGCKWCWFETGFDGVKWSVGGVEIVFGQTSHLWKSIKDAVIYIMLKIKGKVIPSWLFIVADEKLHQLKKRCVFTGKF